MAANPISQEGRQDADFGDEPNKRRFNIVIVASGTRGELQPYIALGIALQNRGHKVSFASERRMEVKEKNRYFI